MRRMNGKGGKKKWGDWEEGESALGARRWLAAICMSEGEVDRVRRMNGNGYMEGEIGCEGIVGSKKCDLGGCIVGRG
ncbi:hypothetical protein Pmani_032999 [Petrolisthes manimaculis]|uniref:Uncharacterized protein n=1 Tax=Petrolisthes manimaculis TaxID=1843537 RepID=A0AAE1NSF8_9EUCA|nr:hypothetical protein Pmani_032999 [Petrolisthes manimaculis]